MLSVSRYRLKILETEFMDICLAVLFILFSLSRVSLSESLLDVILLIIVSIN